MFTCTKTKTGFLKYPITTVDTQVHVFELFTNQDLLSHLKRGLCVCHQVPAALLTFAWDAAVQADIAAAGGKSPSLLNPELLKNIRTLS